MLCLVNNNCSSVVVESLVNADLTDKMAENSVRIERNGCRARKLTIVLQQLSKLMLTNPQVKAKQIFSWLNGGDTKLIYDCFDHSHPLMGE